jgi:hypothetical protein
LVDELDEKERRMDILTFYTDPANEYLDDHKVILYKKCFGLRKVWKDVAWLKERKAPLQQEIDELIAKIDKWEKTAAATEVVDEDFSKSMNFTGKCIVTFSSSEDANQAQDTFCHFQ